MNNEYIQSLNFSAEKIWIAFSTDRDLNCLAVPIEKMKAAGFARDITKLKDQIETFKYL